MVWRRELGRKLGGRVVILRSDVYDLYVSYVVAAL